MSKKLQKLAERLNGEGFQSVTSIAWYKNFRSMYAVTYFCFKCNNFVRKSMYVCGLGEIKNIHMCYYRSFKAFLSPIYP